MRSLLFLWAIPLACAASPQVLLSAETESDLNGGVTPPDAVVQLILRNEPDDMAWLHECMVEKGFGKKAAAKFFTAKAIHLNRDGVPDYFVRPALRPYCHAFYGAHLFRYWFLTGHRTHGKTTYKIVFKNGGDEARILANVTNGYRDLALMGHTAAEAYTTIWRFNGKDYAQAGCIRQVMGDNGWTGDSPCPAIDDSTDSGKVTATPPDPSPPRSSTSPPSPPPAAGG